MKNALVIGGGFAGCASAHVLDLQGGWNVTLVESAPFLGAGNKTQWYGGHPYTFGPRHFLTRNEDVFEFLNKYCPLRRCGEHIFLSYVESDEKFYNYPIHVDDIPLMPESNQILSEIENTEKRIRHCKNSNDCTLELHTFVLIANLAAMTQATHKCYNDGLNGQTTCITLKE